MSRLTGRINKREEALHNLELARKQRLLPVQCWEKQWVTPQGVQPGSTYKVLKWVKTDKKQDFSDDEAAGAETDEQQAPLRDEMEALAGAADQEIEELEAADRENGEDGDSRAGSEDAADKPRKSVLDDVGTGDVTPAGNSDLPGRSPLPPSPPPLGRTNSHSKK
ncbi:hypothetical protein FRB99_000195, partial [Tulasnella sp. 403]